MTAAVPFPPLSLSSAFEIVAVATIAYLALYHAYMLGTVILGAREIRRQRRYSAFPWDRLPADSTLFPGVSVIVPAYNEDLTISRTLRSLLALRYPSLEVIVVNDGSTDGTLSRLWREFALWPSKERPAAAIPTQNVRAVLESRVDARLKVVDKRNGGKADALNAGINMATNPLVCAVDADVILDRRALELLVLAFLEDDATIAAGGTVQLYNGCTLEDGEVVEKGLPKTFLERCQLLEFTRSMVLGRLFFNTLGAHLIISGAFGLFSREVLLEVGGYQPYAIGEDMELVVRMHRHMRERKRRYRIHFVAEALCYTEAPYDLRDLGKQRTRWHQGLLTTLRLHRSMLLRRRYGSVGMVAFPLYSLFELLSPVVEAIGWLTLPLAFACGWLSSGAFLLFLAASILFGVLVSQAAVLLDSLSLQSLPTLRDRLRLGTCALLENLGYHQILLYFRLRAFPRYYRSVHLKGGWTSPSRLLGRAPRTGA